jgi:hypothetical protein
MSAPTRKNVKKSKKTHGYTKFIADSSPGGRIRRLANHLREDKEVQACHE